MKDQGANVSKQIVYIIGAGASQAEASHKGGEPVSMMMKNSPIGDGVASRVIARSGINRDLDLIDEVDIEKLISLLAATGKKKYIQQAEALRRAYFEELVESLAKTGVLENPELAITLLEFHKNVNYKKSEVLSGIINLNHDTLFQCASQEVHGCINIGFAFNSKFFSNGSGEKAPIIVQLHGSFNWTKAIPIRVLNLTANSKYDTDILWIPPTTLKESKDYPYNKLMGLSYELLTKECDILRIIGCSLSQNDWNLISLIFNAQYFQYYSNNKRCFRIELIMDQKTGKNIEREYSYLKNLVPIGFLKDGDFSAYKEELISQEMENPFKYWLKTKMQYHIKLDEISSDDLTDTMKKIIT